MACSAACLRVISVVLTGYFAVNFLVSLLSENVHYPSRFIDNGFAWTEDA